MKSLQTPIIPLLLLFAATACGKSGSESSGDSSGDKPTSVEIKELGVKADLPAGFSLKELRGKPWISKSQMYGASLEKKGAMPASLDEATKSFMSGKVADKGEVAGGGYYAVIETEFPTAGGGEPMKLPFVHVLVPAATDTVLCSGQLQAGDDPKPLLAACKSLKPL